MVGLGMSYDNLVSRSKVHLATGAYFWNFGIYPKRAAGIGYMSNACRIGLVCMHVVVSPLSLKSLLYTAASTTSPEGGDIANWSA